MNHQAKIDTIVFDKTGTLTTGQSQVIHHEGIIDELWYKIYLLETACGKNHPLAKAVIRYYQKQIAHQSLFKDIEIIKTPFESKGISAFVQGIRIDIGSEQYLQALGIHVSALSAKAKHLVNEGSTAVYVAQNLQYRGVIMIKHQIRPKIKQQLLDLKSLGKKLILLTGDNLKAAKAFNQQYKKPLQIIVFMLNKLQKKKKHFWKNLFENQDNNPGIWFVGDGLNDSPCAKMVSQQGGVSCAITAFDQAAFFTDIYLDGSLTYILKTRTNPKISKKNYWAKSNLIKL